ncbi:hypothetical protein KDL45_03485 [bacterium]|nr:hypothetical protein [bacterium]
MRRRIFQIALVVSLLAVASFARAHMVNSRQQHHMDITLAKDMVYVRYEYEAPPPTTLPSMTEEQMDKAEIRTAKRVARLVALALNGEKISLELLDRDRTETLQIFNLEAKLPAKPGVNHLTILNMNLLYAADGYVSLTAEEGVHLSRELAREPVFGEINIRYGVGPTSPPADQLAVEWRPPPTASSHGHQKPGDSRINSQVPSPPEPDVEVQGVAVDPVKVVSRGDSKDLRALGAFVVIFALLLIAVAGYFLLRSKR